MPEAKFCICEGDPDRCDSAANKREEACAKHGEKWLCYDCWHAAREREQCYHVRSRSNPHRCSHAAFIPCTYLYEEAVERAAELNAMQGKNDPGDFEPVAVPTWAGERTTHPGYMAQRRACIMAEHPEYGHG